MCALLAQAAAGLRCRAIRCGPPWIDVEAAAAGVARLHAKRLRPALRQQVDEDALHALLVEFGMVAEADQVAQQAGAVDARAAIGDGHVRPVRLAGDRAIGFQQAAAQGFLDHLGSVRGEQRRLRRAVAVDPDLERVDAFAFDIAQRRQEIDSLARELVESGLALWENAGEPSERLIVRGQSNLLEPEGDLDRIRTLFDDLERKRDIAEFLDLTEDGEGVRIFIGSENKLFSLSGSSLVVSPYMNADRKVVGAIGVIGPTRLNYGRVVPIVDYTAQLVGRLVSGRTTG